MFIRAGADCLCDLLWFVLAKFQVEKRKQEGVEEDNIRTSSKKKNVVPLADPFIFVINFRGKFLVSARL